MHRLVPALLAASLTAILAACGSSSQTVTSPTTNKCAVTATADTASFAPGGGSGNITVSTNRECQWAAQSSTSWVAIASGSSGQGDGKVSFKVAANGDPSTRSTTINVNDQRVAISQEAAPCQFTVSPLADTVSPAGDRRSVTVSSSSPQCAWKAKSNADWITIENGAEGTGNGTVTYAAQPTTGPPRAASLTVAGQTVTIAQGTGCSITISPTGNAIGAAGGSGTITVTTGAGCAWTATSSDPWISLTSGATGSGPGGVTFTVSAWTGPARTGTIAVNGQVFTITQGAGCSFSLSTSSASVPAGGGGGNVQVITADGCSWNSSSNAGWVSITSGNSGSGRGTVQFTVAQNTGSARDATLTIANQPFAVNQPAAPCTYAIAPGGADFPDSAAHTGSFTLTASRADCAWTATASDAWIQITSGASGAGTATINFSVTTNSGPARPGSIAVAGQTFTITQAAAAPCTYSIAPGGADFTDSAAHTGSFTLTASRADCAWTATASDAWIQITSGASGTGTATINFSVIANGGSAARSGSIAVAGQTFTITQAAAPPAPCTYSIAPGGADFTDSAAHTGSFTLTASRAECAWTATASDAWIQITSGASGTGTATIDFSVTTNDGPARSGSIAVAGQTFAITQAAAPCTYSIAPAGADFTDAAAHTGSFTLTASRADCAWTATASDPWIQITSGASGTGTATIDFSVLANGASARSGSIAVAGKTFAITQAGTSEEDDDR